MRQFLAVTMVVLVATGCTTPAETTTTTESTTTTTSEPPDGGDAPEPQPEETGTTTVADTTTTESPVVEFGTRDNPVPVGDSAPVGDYEISVVAYESDATNTVLAYNQFNEPPADPEAVFSLITLSITYVGDESGEPWIDLIWSSVGASNVSADSLECTTYPNDLFEAGELFPGGTVESNICLTVKQSDLDSLVLFLENTFSFDSERVFFALR